VKATNEHIDPHELLVKYITGETGVAEKLQVEQWIAANAENRQYYEHFKQIWDESRELANDNVIDEDKAWGRFRELIQKEYITSTTRADNYQWLKVAAILLLVSAAIPFVPGLFRHREEVRYATIATKQKPQAPIVKPDSLVAVATNNVKNDTLPDGSIITQNKNSTLRYPTAFMGKTRVVELTGEAFFNVRHDPQKPFIIKVNDVQITVLGTSFNVKNSGKTTEVVVETGIVSVQRQQQTAVLHPGEKLIATDTAASFKTEQVTDKSYRKYLDEKVKKPAKKPVKTFKKDGVVKLDSVRRDRIKIPDNKVGN